MPYSNGHDEPGLDLAVEMSAINVKIENVQKNYDIHNEILMKISETQNMLSQKLLALEIHRQNDLALLKSLQKNANLQTKLLGAIILAMVSAAIKYLLHV